MSTREPGEDDGPVEEDPSPAKRRAVAGCTCKSQGTCDVCVGYMRRMDGQISAPLPRVKETE